MEVNNTAAEDETPIKGRVDNFGGFIVDYKYVCSYHDARRFEVELEESIKLWKSKGRRGIWLKIPIQNSDYIPIATENGFIFHHAQAEFIMMTLWMPTETPSTLPNYATHFVGVGGFVVNDKNEVLVIQEKNGPITTIWKVPGGMANPGEEIYEAAMREVFEETGIKTEFVSLLCFRQAKHLFFTGLVDLYFVCRLKPLTHEIKLDPSEIKDCKWMPVEEFVALPYYKGVYGKMVGIQKENADGNYDGFKMESLPSYFRPGENALYHGSKL